MYSIKRTSTFITSSTTTATFLDFDRSEKLLFSAVRFLVVCMNIFFRNKNCT